MIKLTASEAKGLIDRVGPSLGYDHTYDPVFSEGRRDVCAVRRLAENGTTYGFDTVYLVWKELSGVVQCKEICNSRSTKDYVYVDSIVANEDGTVTVRFSSGGMFSGAPWKNSSTINPQRRNQ